MIHEKAAAAALTAALRDLHDQRSMRATLDRIIHHANDLIGDCDYAGIARVRGRSVHTLAASHDRVKELDLAQRTSGEGPCFTVSLDRTEVLTVPDLSAESDRWPAFTATARRLGVGSMVVLLLCDYRTTLGTLTLYREAPGPFAASTERIGLTLASHASVAFACARADTNLQTALVRGTAVGEAIGVAMERHRISATEAFALLAKVSQDRDTEILDVAREVTRTGGFRLGA